MISAAIASGQDKVVLPKKDITPFEDNDVTKYKSFMLNFERFIEARCPEAGDRLIYLGQYTQGKPLKLVKSCTHYDAATAYRKAKELLHMEYGNEFMSNLCFGCFCSGHMSKDCTLRSTCGIRKQRHPTALHDLSRSSEPPNTNRPTTSDCVAPKDVPIEQDVEELPHLKDAPSKFMDSDTLLLLGMNAPELIKPRDVIGGEDNLPSPPGTLWAGP
ncbi:hypothetical protein HAZT_HAZT006353 [Hyalella azteca]|uniref:CCHC-type domain-containing protein n=1 Tax=Hyalella azteca TaxID=294128 RepID=A0A6A0HA65_HYAAZ|nr:hypothetical protein HAZT_HAZT006353 [Hyalella azteca]